MLHSANISSAVSVFMSACIKSLIASMALLCILNTRKHIGPHTAIYILVATTTTTAERPNAIRKHKTGKKPKAPMNGK